jgi:homoserine dehydrogenase
MKKSINIEKMTPNPFSEVSLIDMNYAKELGYKIKPLAVIEDMDGKLIYRVGPCLIQQNHAVANVVDNYNIIVIEGSNSGLLGFYGQGAGAKPTASAMFDDLINVLTVSKEYADIITREQFTDMSQVKEYCHYTNNLYWRFTVENKVGVLAKICTIFMNNDTNIVKLIQKDDVDGEIDVVLLTTCADAVTINNITTQLAEHSILINARIPFFND